MTVKKKSVKKASVKKAVTKKRVVKKKAPAKKRVTKRTTKKRAPKKVELDDFGLTLKEREFADLWRGGPDEVRGNAKRSYMKVHPRVKERTAETEGAKLLRKPEIDSYLQLKAKEITEKCDINAQWLLERLADEATADIADIYDEAGALKPVHTWPKIWRQGLVAGLDVHQEYRYQDGERIPDGVIMKVKISDRIKRLELIGKLAVVNAFGDNEKDKGANVTVIIEDKDSNA